YSSWDGRHGRHRLGWWTVRELRDGARLVDRRRLVVAQCRELSRPAPVAAHPDPLSIWLSLCASGRRIRSFTRALDRGPAVRVCAYCPACGKVRRWFAAHIQPSRSLVFRSRVLSLACCRRRRTGTSFASDPPVEAKTITPRFEFLC